MGILVRKAQFVQTRHGGKALYTSTQISVMEWNARSGEVGGIGQQE